MKNIELTKGRVAIVDDQDFDYLNNYKWHAIKGQNTFYAQRSIRKNGEKKETVKMHRAIMHTPAGMETDHIDGDGLNNLRSNLRIVTKAQNQQNAGLRTNNTSGLRGVSWRRSTKKWTSRIKKTGGKYLSLGCFVSKEEAHAAYLSASEKYHGAFGRYKQIKNDK